MIIFYIAHPISKLKAKIDVYNIKRLSKYNIIYIITTKDLEFNNYLKKLNLKNLKYYEIENNNLLDFGKYYYAAKEILPTINLSNEFNESNESNVCNVCITFINDSIILKNRLKNYFNMINDKANNNIEMFGMLDSYEYKYHYQSYLFSIRYNSIYKFINFIENYINKYGISDNNKQHVIQNLELNLKDQFDSTKSFINVKENTHNVFNSRKLIKKYSKKGLDIIKFTNLINSNSISIDKLKKINKKVIESIIFKIISK